MFSWILNTCTSSKSILSCCYHSNIFILIIVSYCNFLPTNQYDTILRVFKGSTHDCVLPRLPKRSRCRSGALSELQLGVKWWPAWMLEIQYLRIQCRCFSAHTGFFNLRLLLDDGDWCGSLGGTLSQASSKKGTCKPAIWHHLTWIKMVSRAEHGEAEKNNCKKGYILDLNLNGNFWAVNYPINSILMLTQGRPWKFHGNIYIEARQLFFYGKCVPYPSLSSYC